jgi:T5SS/PEP-CTERM-associated repeat protein
VAILAILSAPALATVTTTGDVDPLDASTWDSSTYVYVGQTSAGSLAIDGADSVSCRFGYVGYGSGSTGVVDISGAGSKWTSAFGLYVGYNYGSSGTLNITNGGKVSSVANCLAKRSSATAAVTVDGAGSTWENTSFIQVGYDGDATLKISGGGKVTDKDGYIGYNTPSESSVQVDGAGSTWENSRDLFVGYQGDGTLEITGGGKVTNEEAYIGALSMSTSAVTVDGPGSSWASSDNLYVGNSGAGTLTITNAGLVSVAGTLTIDKNGGADSWINMSTGGMLALKGSAAGSLTDFFGLIYGSDAINYWNGTAWDDIDNAVFGTDYTLAYWDQGSLAGYTVLTVGTYISPEVPAPSSLLLASAGLVLVRRLRRRNV